MTTATELLFLIRDAEAAIKKGIRPDHVVALHLETPHARYPVRSLRTVSSDMIQVETRGSDPNTARLILLSVAQVVFSFSVSIPTTESEGKEMGFHVSIDK